MSYSGSIELQVSYTVVLSNNKNQQQSKEQRIKDFNLLYYIIGIFTMKAGLVTAGLSMLSSHYYVKSVT